MPVAEVYNRMKEKLEGTVPEFELKYKAEIADEILRLKRERNAVILAHNYMEPALFYSVPDYQGDSLELSRRAAETDADIIIFCGVRFMAETAKILSPQKTVLLPAKKAGCSLAASITAEDVRKLKEQFPGVPVVTYINTYADVKAETDICCTSSNAAAVVTSLNSDTVIFLPDEYLAKNTARETGVNIVFPTVTGYEVLEGRKPVRPRRHGNAALQAMIGWHGRCEVHEKFSVEDIENARKQFPDVLVLAHPECPPDVVEASDFSGSTTAIVKYVQESQAERYLILTECSMADNIAAENPDKEMLRMCSIRCPHMNEITLEETRDALLKTQYVIEIPEETRLKAYSAVKRMIEIGARGKVD